MTVFSPPFKPGDLVSSAEICDAFQCSPQGGMRRSHKTNTLLITSDPSKLYSDRWEGSILHYTGMGTTGEQSLDYMQNRTLAESEENGVAVFLCEQLEKGRYLYQGRVALAGDPYQEVQLDAEQQERNVWMFPLALEGGRFPTPPSLAVVQKAEQKRRREAAELTTAELVQRIQKKTSHTPAERLYARVEYSRDPRVREVVLRRADGRCELCEEPAPFNDPDGKPYLEAHHIKWLAKGGKDTVENSVALCPNCHRRMHVVDSSRDRTKLQKKAATEIREAR